MPTTIKIAGLSGAGKSTLIRAYTREHPDVAAMSYGEFLARHGARADDEWRQYLNGRRGLVLMDEHLEYGDRDLAETYIHERTAGIFALDPPIVALLERRRRDATRARDLDAALAEREAAKSTARAASLSEQLSIPLCVVRNMTIAESLAELERFITCAG